jgi:UDP-N-acetylmuramyl pentapeptide phosphotransferase/UDP-N-acetylglucosamine-1-phosphate transferase
MVTLVGLFLIAISGALIWSQWRSRGRVADRGQIRRRMLTSALMGLLGVAIVAGQFILAAVTPIAFMLFWLAVLCLAGLLGLSGFLDLLVTRSKTRRQLQDHALELRRLQGELAKAKERDRELAYRKNGKSAS